MSLNFKLLRRSFSLRNNVTEKSDDKNVSNMFKESIGLDCPKKLSSSLSTPSKNEKLKPNSNDDSSSIDSYSEAKIKMENFIPYARLNPIASSGMQLTSVRRREHEHNSLLVDSTSVSKKSSKHALNQQVNGASEVEFPPTKMSKKQLKVAQDQLKKLTKINIHLSALFSAVECGHSDKAKSILESTDVNVNCLNSDALSPLDVAVLSNNRSLTKILLEHGASHGARFKNCESLGNHLNSLLEDALNKINDYTCGSHDDLGGQDADKQIDFWQRRANSLQRILRGWVQSTVPHPPNCVIVDVTSCTSVAVRVQEPLTGAITTKFKIQWSLTADFSNVIDEREINDLTNSHGVMSSTLHLYNLIHGQRYYFRALSGNIKGWSEHRLSSPRSVVPSSWQDIANKLTPNNKRSLEDLVAKVRHFRRMTQSEIPIDIPSTNGWCIKKKVTIKQLFTATSKFQKQLKRGIYLACLLYHDGKVLVTNDDSLPVVEIDDNYPNNSQCEYAWMSKLSCNWDVIKTLRNEMEKYSTSVNQFRLKILSAISQMQSIMGLKDLGTFYYKSLQDSHGTIVISCINYIKNPKSISVLNSRWMPLRKIQRKLMPVNDGSNINEIILASIQNQIEYHQTVHEKLPKGLYVGYLKMHCSMEQMHVVVPAKTPNALPHQKIRDNQHVSSEEWEVFQENFNQNEKSENQKRFIATFSTAAMRLFKYMGIATECMLMHKLYNLELIKLSHDVSFLIICPPIELACSLMNYPPAQREMLLQRTDLLSIPTQSFEMCQLFTYDPDSVQKCARLSVIMDLEATEANHSHREAFSTCEAQAAKEHLNQLQEIKVDLTEYWKSMRWLLDVMTFARNRCADTGISIRSILNLDGEPSAERCEENGTSEQLVETPSSDNVDSSRLPCRLSWPNSNIRSDIVTASLSKSDQQLNFVMSNVTCRRKTEVDCSRRNSADAKYQHYMQASDEALNHFDAVERHTLCKSEETLSTSKQSFSPVLQRKRSETINARICSAKCVECNKSPSPTSSSSSSKPDHHANENGSSESKDASSTCIIDNHSTINDDEKTVKIESNSHQTDDLNKENLCNDADNHLQFGTIEVYIANELNGINGIRLRLHATTRTTAREIIDLVVNQCNQSMLHTDDDTLSACNRLDSRKWCLFAIFGNQGRCVPDNFRPLQLQNPWRKGRLYVRRSHDIVAEIEHSNRDVHNI